MSQHYDVAAVRKSFPAAEHVVYLDSGFQTPLSLPVKEAYDRFLREGLRNRRPQADLAQSSRRDSRQGRCFSWRQTA